MDDNDIILTKVNGIATITLNRPEKLNAMTTHMWKHLPELIQEVDGDDKINVLVIIGAANAFCAGSDVGRLQSRIEGVKPEKTKKELTSPVGNEILSIARLKKPTIAAVNGVAAGAGISIALACDIRIASDQAKFVASWVKIGLMPDGGSTFFLTRYIGISRTLEFVLSGGSITAFEAEKIGLVNKVVPKDRLSAEVNELAKVISDGPPIAIELIKKTVWQALYANLENQLDFESYGQNICRQTEDHKEGLSAFIQKRKAVFKGR